MKIRTKNWGDEERTVEGNVKDKKNFLLFNSNYFFPFLYTGLLSLTALLDNQ